MTTSSPTANLADAKANKFSLTNVATSTPAIALLGVPFDNVTTAETIELVELMVASRKPHYLATANVDFLVQAQEDVELRRILMDAHLVLCDGTPLLWASRLLGNPLPERVAGSDLVPLLIQTAARKKYKIFFLGGTPENTSLAVRKIKEQHPELIIAGHYSPPFAHLLEMNHEEIRQRIAAAKPDLLFVSFGCPKQEKWISMHYRSLNVPVSVGVGATIDFLAGATKRAPKWMQKSGLEWTFRLLQEPRRLFKRYAKDLFCFTLGIAKQWWRMRHSPRAIHLLRTSSVRAVQVWQQVKLQSRMDIETVRRDALICEEALSKSRCCLLELSQVNFIDSTGVGLLIRLQKKARITGRHLILVAPSKQVISILHLMKLRDFFRIARDINEGFSMIENFSSQSVLIQPNYHPSKPALSWRGEITAANAGEVWATTAEYIASTQACSLQIDLSSLQFIDSAGVGMMISARKHAKDRGVNLEFIGIQPNVRNVLQIAKLENFLLSKVA